MSIKLATDAQSSASVSIARLKKAIVLYLLHENQENNIIAQNICGESVKQLQQQFQKIHAICQEIMLDGLKLAQMQRTSPPPGNPGNNNIAATQSFIVAFECARRKSLQQLQLCFNDASLSKTIEKATVVSSHHPTKVAISNQSPGKTSDITQFLHLWIFENLQKRILSKSLQSLLAEQPLLEMYYAEAAFMRNKMHTKAFFICLSALESNECSLLHELDEPQSIDAMLDDETTMMTTTPLGIEVTESETAEHVHDANLSTNHIYEQMPITQRTVFSNSCMRPCPVSQPSVSTPKKSISIPKAAFRQLRHRNVAAYSNSLSSCSGTDDTAQASTSIPCRDGASLHKRLAVPSANSSTNSTPSCNTNDSSSSASLATTQRIQLIKCDDIKIWTDQSLERSPLAITNTCNLPRAPASTLSMQNAQKSISPMNSFLSNLFDTPPTYASWFVPESAANLPETDAYEATSDAVYPCNTALAQQPQQQQQLLLNNSSSVFDSFLPVCGKKMRSCNSQNLFEDGISTLDYTYSIPKLDNTTLNVGCDEQTLKTHKEPNAPNGNSKSTLKKSQSLTAFLQSAQLSRNNTQLEKENAHFRISEAIISAIEHMKCAKLEAEKEQLTSATAVDCLKSENEGPKDLLTQKEYELLTDSVSEETIAYAELEDNIFDSHSAEVVGLSLISKFSEQHLPKVSELKWLVSEEDTPQQLLPMPDASPSANPDENILPSMTRGTRYWAPPRPQIIFTDFPPQDRRQLIEKQNNRCAGCGMRVSPQYLHSFRYCTYLGKYHCTGCHRNQISATPAKILHAWDFKCYPVSVFAYRLLEQMFHFPLFYVPDLNPTLYVRQQLLLAARKKRIQLKFVKDFVRMCRFATREQKYFDAIPIYLTEDVDLWSMADFIDTRNKSMKRSIECLIEKCENHIFNCVLCNAHGFRCEHCSKDDIIFPWAKKVYRCDRCGTCYHLSCWKTMLNVCSKCQRINKRRNEQLLNVETI